MNLWLTQGDENQVVLDCAVTYWPTDGFTGYKKTHVLYQGTTSVVP